MAMDSINLIPSMIAPRRLLMIISPTMKQLINLKSTVLANHLSTLLTPIKNILPDAKLKEWIMHD